MQRDHRKWLWWVAVGIWSAVVLGLSGNQFSDESTSGFLAPLVRWLLPGLSAEAQKFLHSTLPRTAAHAFEYAVLAALAFRALRESTSPRRSAGFALALIVAVATIDETRQAFAVTRTGSATDALIDVAAGAAALLLLLGIPRLVQARRAGREAGG
jgi:VanZ family protein